MFYNVFDEKDSLNPARCSSTKHIKLERQSITMCLVGDWSCKSWHRRKSFLLCNSYQWFGKQLLLVHRPNLMLLPCCRTGGFPAPSFDLHLKIQPCTYK